MDSRLVEHLDVVGAEPEPTPAPMKWAAVLGIAVPPGTVLHPTVLEHLHAHLVGRGAVIHRAADRVSLVCAVDGKSRPAASADAADVEGYVLNLLRLSASAVYERTLEEPCSFEERLDRMGWGAPLGMVVEMDPGVGRRLGPKAGNS
jgi:hypothetical protein